MLRAGTETFHTAHAAVFTEHKLRAGLLGFRVGTPDAPERTAFQKYGGADAWPVVHGEGLNIKKYAFQNRFTVLVRPGQKPYSLPSSSPQGVEKQPDPVR